MPWSQSLTATQLHHLCALPARLKAALPEALAASGELHHLLRQEAVEEAGGGRFQKRSFSEDRAITPSLNPKPLVGLRVREAFADGRDVRASLPAV